MMLIKSALNDIEGKSNDKYGERTQLLVCTETRQRRCSTYRKFETISFVKFYYNNNFLFLFICIGE